METESYIIIAAGITGLSCINYTGNTPCTWNSQARLSIWRPDFGVPPCLSRGREMWEGWFTSMDTRSMTLFVEDTIFYVSASLLAFFLFWQISIIISVTIAKELKLGTCVIYYTGEVPHAVPAVESHLWEGGNPLPCMFRLTPRVENT